MIFKLGELFCGTGGIAKGATSAEPGFFSRLHEMLVLLRVRLQDAVADGLFRVEVYVRELLDELIKNLALSKFGSRTFEKYAESMLQAIVFPNQRGCYGKGAFFVLFLMTIFSGNNSLYIEERRINNEL